MWVVGKDFLSIGTQQQLGSECGDVEDQSTIPKALVPIVLLEIPEIPLIQETNIPIFQGNVEVRPLVLPKNPLFGRGLPSQYQPLIAQSSLQGLPLGMVVCTFEPSGLADM